MDKRLLEILACPSCKVGVELKNDKLVCINCGREYLIKDDVPIMLEGNIEKKDGKWIYEKEKSDEASKGS